MPRKLKFEPEYIADAVIKARGMITVATKLAGCSHNTLYRYREDFPVVAEAFRQARESILDLAENELFKAIQDGEPWAITFFLKSKGGERGYGDKVEHTGEVKMKIDWDEMYKQSEQ